MRITIRSRILIIFVGVFCIQALTIGAFLLYQHNKDIHDRTQQQLYSDSQNISRQVSSFFHGVLHDLETAGQQIERIAQKDYQRHHLLYTLQENNPAFSALVFYDLNGIVKSAVSDKYDENIPHCFLNNTKLFEIPYNSGKPFIQPLEDKEGNRCITISQPVFFLNNSYVIGVISALVPYTNLQTILDQTSLPKHHGVMILNDKGLLIAQKQNVGNSFEVKEAFYEIKIDDTKYLNAAISINFFNQKFTIISLVSKDNSINFFTKSFYELAGLTFVMLLMSFLVGITTFKKIIAPLQKVATSSADMAKGDSVDSFHLSNDSEFHDLGTALQSINHQLLDSNESLGQEVLKRKEEGKIAILAKLDAEKENQAKSIFLANMSHEIRTPLYSMLGMLKTLRKEPLSQEQTRNLSMTFVAGERLLTILNSILDLSQIESGKFQLITSSFSLSKLLIEVVDLMNYQAEEKEIKVSSIIPHNIQDSLLGDSGRIRQILINLISNSIKFSQQGIIRIKVEELPHVKENKIKLLFSITDNGEGISEQDQQNIFAAFERGKLKSDMVIEGSGLGLAISSEFVEYMGGKLWLEKSGSEGSTFCFTIQCAIDHNTSISDTASNASLATTDVGSLSGLHIMLAEDEFINQRIISAYLEELGAHVTVCQHGKELLNKMQQDEADIVLMDIRMPVMNGLEATERIRAIEAKSSQRPIPIIALTAQASTEFEVKCRNAGMNEYLTKPIPFNQLVTVILELVKK